jgi:hypothetical protein
LGLVSDYTFALLAVLAVGWFLSWWVPERFRWYLLFAAAVVSVLCIGLGVVRFFGHKQLDPPKPYSCSWVLECTDPSPLFWIVGGLLGLECSFVLVLTTFAVGFVRDRMGFGKVATLSRKSHENR